MMRKEKRPERGLGGGEEEKDPGPHLIWINLRPRNLVCGGEGGGLIQENFYFMVEFVQKLNFFSTFGSSNERRAFGGGGFSWGSVLSSGS